MIRSAAKLAARWRNRGFACTAAACRSAALLRASAATVSEKARDRAAPTSRRAFPARCSSASRTSGLLAYFNVPDAPAAESAGQRRAQERRDSRRLPGFRESTRRRKKAATTFAARCWARSSPTEEKLLAEARIALCRRRAGAAARGARATPRNIGSASRGCARRSAARAQRRGAQEGARLQQVSSRALHLRRHTAMRARMSPRACRRDFAAVVTRTCSSCRDASPRDICRCFLRRPPPHAPIRARAPGDRGAAHRPRSPHRATPIPPPKTCSSCRGRSSSDTRRAQVFGDAPALLAPRSTRRVAAAPAYTEQELELGVNGKPQLHLTCTVSPVDRRTRRRRCCSSSATSTSS